MSPIGRDWVWITALGRLEETNELNENSIRAEVAAPLDTGASLAFERTFLAHERTQKAWVRTALSLISFGFGIAKFFDNFNRLRVIETNHCEVLLEILSSAGRFDPACSDFGAHDHGHAAGCGPLCDQEGRGHDHTKAFSTWSFETDRLMSLEALRAAARKLPGNIYRAKGTICGVETPHQQASASRPRRGDTHGHDPWRAFERFGAIRAAVGLAHAACRRRELRGRGAASAALLHPSIQRVRSYAIHAGRLGQARRSLRASSPRLTARALQSAQTLLGADFQNRGRRWRHHR